MVREKVMYVLVTLFAVTLASVLHPSQPKGRKLFGGYRIAPKACRPENPGRLKSEARAICMFNYECSSHGGEVVGTCMDGFLFGACCQLPAGAHDRTTTTTTDAHHAVDHVPDLPILLNPDGTPLGPTTDKSQLTEDTFSTLLGPDDALDDLKLPSLIGHSGNDITDEPHRVTPAVNPVTTLLSPDQILQVADPVDQLPALFSHGLPKNNGTASTQNANGTLVDTILLNENGTAIEHGSDDPDELFRPTRLGDTHTPSMGLEPKTATTRINGYEEKSTRPMQSVEATTPLGLSTRSGEDEELVRVPTITYAGQPANEKKHEETDREEIAINHIISILNDTKTTKAALGSGGPTTTSYSYGNSYGTGASVPTLFKIITTHSLPPSTTEPLPIIVSSSSPTYGPSSLSPSYYHYITDSGQLSSSPYFPSSGSPPLSSPYFPSSSSPPLSTSYTGSSIGPTTNPPAPTVIVLGPLGTEYASSTPTPGPRPSNIIRKPPGVATTLTHNISTVISGNKQVLSVSYISVDLKDGTSTARPSPTVKRPSTIYTTLTTWSEKPSFHLRPISSTTSTPPPITTTTTTTNSCDDDTPGPEDVNNNFPPVRHPELDSAHQDNKPEIVSADEIPSPEFVEDAELDNKVDVFVNKIVESLKDNFENLKDVVYNSKNTTSTSTRRPATTQQPTKRPFLGSRPSPTRSSTRRPSTTPKPRPTTPRGKPSTTTTRRPKPVKKSPTPATPTTTTTTTTTTTIQEASKPIEPSTTTPFPEITSNADFRTICGVRPLVKTGRIVGGKGATFGEWPWQVLVREATWLGLFTKNKCGGVLITDKFVITAAHCQPGFLASLVAVFGEFDISGELESRRSLTRNVRRVIVNRAYDPATFENDLALLELETPVLFDLHIVPICMPNDNTDYVNRMATVTGWGRLKYNGGVPSVLQEVKVPIMENSVCQEMFQTAGHSKLILDSFMCAGYANGQKDSCEGDSGGPLTLQREDGRWMLVGTVSHGIKCAAPYLPGVYMRTTYFKPWLHSITGV
ncbi:mucin-2 [Copidosoma floridanum]|uniref:mucin-2 n=1 Tax=Copidosoma floridanum TaxID=29053 RepID=UPI0006C94041|nr:mucin-2 [Copidosoma floridanum]